MSSPTRTVSSLAVTATSPTLAMERTVLTQSFPDQSTPSNTLLSTSTGVVVQSTLVTPAGTAAPAYGVAVVDPRLQATNVVINPHQYPAVVQTKTPMGVDPMGGYFNQKYTPVLPSLNSVTLEMPKGPATRVNFIRQGESPSHDLVGITTAGVYQAAYGTDPQGPVRAPTADPAKATTTGDAYFAAHRSVPEPHYLNVIPEQPFYSQAGIGTLRETIHHAVSQERNTYIPVSTVVMPTTPYATAGEALPPSISSASAAPPAHVDTAYVRINGGGSGVVQRSPGRGPEPSALSTTHFNSTPAPVGNATVMGQSVLSSTPLLIAAGTLTPSSFTETVLPQLLNAGEEPVVIRGSAGGATIITRASPTRS